MNNEQRPARPPSGAGTGEGANTGFPGQVMPPGVINPASLPVHIQEQLRRQMQSQASMQQQRSQGMPMAGMQPSGFSSAQMTQMNVPGSMFNPRLMGQTGQLPRPLMQVQSQLQQTQHQQRKLTIPPARLAALSQVKPYYSGIDEHTFMMSLSQFLACVNIPLIKPPILQGRQISLLALFNTVTAFGGFAMVSEGKRWPAVAATLSLNPTNMDSLAALHSVYGSFLYPYEQFMFHKIPAEAIQWPNSVIKAFESGVGLNPSANPQMITGALGNQPGNRLMSAIPRPSISQHPSVSSTPGPFKILSPGGTPQAVLDAIGLSQWKSVHAIKDPFSVLSRGRYAYRDICLYLESGIEYLQIYGLNQLQLLCLDSACPTPDPVSMRQLLHLLFSIVSNRDQETSSESLWKLARTSMFTCYELDCKEPDDLIDLISSIVRSWISRSDAKQTFEAAITSEALSSLFNWSISSDSYETRKNCLLILSDLSPATISRLGNSKIYALFLNSCEQNLADLVPLILDSSHRSFLSWEYFIGDCEAIKKTIMSMIPGSTTVFKMIPGLAFVQLEIAYKILHQFARLDAPQKKNNRMMIQAITKFVPALIELFRLFIQPIAKLCRLIKALLSSEDFLKNAEYIKWIQKILHSSSFGLPDGGYLELIILCVGSALQCLDGEDLKSVLETSCLTDTFVLAVNSIRSMWLIPKAEIVINFERHVQITNPPHTNGVSRATKTLTTVLTDKSPLLWQQPSSATSHPYQLYIHLLKILDSLVIRAPCLMQRQLGRHSGIFLDWVCGEGICSELSREVLMTPDLREIYTHLLMSSLS